jgi:parafibromin
MSGPLHILRQALQSGTPIIDSDPDFLQIGDTKLPMSDLTEYRRKRGADTPYTLDAVWFMYKHRDVHWAEYVQICQNTTHYSVIFQDRSEILDWLSGTKTTVKGIPEEAPEPAHEPEFPAIPAPEPVLGVDRPPVDAPLDFPTSFDFPASSRPILYDDGPTVEYERIRPLDSVIICPNDFSEMRNRNDVIVQQSRSRSDATSRADGGSSRPQGDEDDSFINPIKAVSQSRFQNLIILVSRSNKSRINNTNIEKFLNDGVWVAPTIDTNRECFTLVHRHTITQHQQKYDVVANEDMLKPDDWAKVVAVFLIGAKWQIKKYVPNDPPTLLSKVLGVYVGWDNEALPDDIAKWNLKAFKINQTQRHADFQVAQHIWQAIEEMTTLVKKRKPD